MSLSEDERKKFEKELKEVENEGNKSISDVFGVMIHEMEKALSRTLTDEDGTPLVRDQDPKFIAERATQFRLEAITAGMRSEELIAKCKGP
jgi:DNA-directed RNA polymerase subunit beta